MPDKEKPESKWFSFTKSNIQGYIDSIERDGKGYYLRLLGPDERASSDGYAMLFYDLANGGKRLVTVPTEIKTREEILDMVRNLKSPEEIDFASKEKMHIDEELRHQLRHDCVFLNVPIAMITFGESKETKQRSAGFYVMGDNSPKEIYANIWYAADALGKENNSNIIPPSEGQYN